MTTKHTPTKRPWRAEENLLGTYSDVMAGTVDDPVCIASDARHENAAFIVRACNAHEELVEALAGVMSLNGSRLDPDLFAFCAAALKKARGE